MGRGRSVLITMEVFSWHRPMKNYCSKDLSSIRRRETREKMLHVTVELVKVIIKGLTLFVHVADVT